MEGFVEHLGRVRPVGFWGWVRLLRLHGQLPSQINCFLNLVSSD